ncbi:MAG: DEAD/DEAH box helicase [Bacteroidia bacterium]|nr:DEAD/DEAH box helicase [Bacteroidia bacterium]
MLVVNTQPFDLVYTLVNHPHLGYVLEPHVVQVNTKGNFTLTHQRIFTKTLDYFAKKLTAFDLTLIKILDELDDDFLFRKFHSVGKKKMRTFEFFEKNKNNELLIGTIRAFIDERMNEALKALRGKYIYKMGNDNNPTSQKIFVTDEQASVLFHFRRDQEGTRYFPTIKYKGERIEFMYKGASVISTSPAWMLLNDQLFDFAKEVDGKKLLPFLNKRFIQITKSAEENYFNRFVPNLIEKYDVYAEGLKIVTKTIDAHTILKVQLYEEEQLSLKITFQYGKNNFDYGSTHQVSAYVEKHGNDYTFIRFKRNLVWEENQKVLLEKLGLIKLNGPYFSLKSEKRIGIIEQELLLPETTNKFEFLEWLNEHTEYLSEQQIVVEQGEDFNKYFIGVRQIKLEVTEQRDWFDVKAVVQFGEYSFNFLALREHILKGKREFILPNGQVAIIPNEWFGNLGGMLNFSTSEDEIKLEKHHVGILDELTNNGGKYLRISDKLERIKSYGDIKDISLPQQFKGELRPYQKAGFNWFYFLKQNSFGGCLADDMGLGKTIQTLALLQKEKELYIATKTQKTEVVAAPLSYPEVNTDRQIGLFENHEEYIPSVVVENSAQPHEASQQSLEDNMKTFIKTSLIVVPNSLVYNWFNEARKFTPQLKVLIYTGIAREKNPQTFLKYDLIISTYGTVRVDIDILSAFKFNYLILDESQSIKNAQSLSSKAVRKLNGTHKLVLTGTPIENSVTELWSQMAFINPGLVGNLQSFTERFVSPIEKAKDQLRLQQLRAVIKPFVLRRTKDQVAKELPEKIEQVVYSNMTEQQAEAYETVKSFYRNEILKSIQEVGLNKAQFTILQGLTKLRQIANHPLLTDANYSGQSGKFDELIARAETAKQEGHKVLIFSQFVKQLDLYKQYFNEKGWVYSYLDGSMSNEQRQAAVNKFQQGQVNYFLISLKAGGVGLNLTEADYVFIIDPWWNPAVEQQAIDRSHRIGQTKTVFTYKFITKDTVEEKILALQQRKKELASSIITSEEGFIKTIDVDEIMELLS